jgi:uncharacterized protein (DUF885 family)
MGYDETPQGHFLYALNQISRAARALIDLELHAGKMTVPEAVNLLIDEVGMDRIVAEAEVRGILIAPAESLSALYGRDANRSASCGARRATGSRPSSTRRRSTTRSSARGRCRSRCCGATWS